MDRYEKLVMLDTMDFSDIMKLISGESYRKGHDHVAIATAALESLEDEERQRIKKMMRTPTYDGASLIRGYKIKGSLLNRARSLVRKDEETALLYLDLAVATHRELEQAWKAVVPSGDAHAVSSSRASTFQSYAECGDWERFVELLTEVGINARWSDAMHLIGGTKQLDFIFKVEVNAEKVPTNVEIIFDGSKVRMEVPTAIGAVILNLARS